MSVPLSNRAGTLSPILHLVWPVLVEQVLSMLVGFSDTLLAGHYLQEPHLAAMTSISYALWMLTNLFAVVSIGATAMVARFVGAGDLPLARRVTNQAFAMGGLMAIALTTVGLVLGERLMWAMQLQGESAELATRYLRFLLPVLPFMMLESVGIACLRGAGDMVTGLITMSLVNLTNIGLSWSLLLGIGPLPELGWDGIAIGTACGHAVGGLIPFVLLARGRAGLTIRASLLKPDRDLMRRILRIGLPGGIDVTSIITCQLAFLTIINRLGPLAAAAHGVAIRIESIAYLPGTAFQVAAATLAGQYLGARDHARATRSIRMTCVLGVSALFVAGLVLFFGAETLAGLFVSSDQAAVATAAAPLLRIIAFGMPSLALQMILTGALRGAGDTRWPLVCTFVGFLGVRFPVAIWLTAYRGFGIRGAWYAMVTDLTVRALLVAARFVQGGWKKTEV